MSLQNNTMATFHLPIFDEICKQFGERMKDIASDIKADRNALRIGIKAGDNATQLVERIEGDRLVRKLPEDSLMM